MLQQLRGVFAKSGKMQFPEHRDLVRQLGADSMVLLKNSGILPLNRGKIALFGAGAVDTVYSGFYYNFVYTDKNVSVKEGLENCGFTFSTGSWLDKMEKSVRQAEKLNRNSDQSKRNPLNFREAEEVPITVSDIAESILDTDTCVYVIRRSPCYVENKLDYQLSEEIYENVKLLCSSFKSVILVLNGGMIELSGVARMKNIKAIVLMGIPGMEAGNSLADVLTGVVNPSGRLTVTWAKKYKDYSTSHNSSRQIIKNDEIDYKEGIFVGYRYFDAFDVTPLYPFGYGLSYTDFSIEPTYFEASWMAILMRVRVTNIGKCSGRQVVQLYCSQPDDKLEMPYQILVSFGKTGKLKPGESEELTLKVPIMAMTTFDEESAAWVVEGGTHLFRIGCNSRNTSLVAKLELDKRTIIKRVAPVMQDYKDMNFIAPPPRLLSEDGCVYSASLSSADYNSENKEVKPVREFKTYIPEGSNYYSYVNENKYEIPYRAKERIEYVKPCGSTTFFDVIKGKISIEEFVSSLSPEILARLAVGDGSESKIESETRFSFDFDLDKKRINYAAQTTSQFSTTLGIPGVSFADGPSGLSLTDIPCTLFPSPINMAQTWDMSAFVRMGRAYGREMEFYDVDYCLAPALNIIRNPMRVRSYEFYAEDPVLGGVLAAGFVTGVKRYEGRNVVLKNLPTFNQENYKMDVNINVNTRAFGELYLRSFSICKFASQPGGLLSTGNRINGTYVTAQRGINTDIVRNDWGFDGFVMSDWGSHSEKTYDLHAGCDLIMPGYDPDKILEGMMDVAPVFEKDGYVQIVDRAYMYDIPMIHYEQWGSFLLDKNGPDVVVTQVAANCPVNPLVYKRQQEGLCKIEVDNEGNKNITYYGINRGAYFALGELQNAVIHLLNEIKNSASMKKLMEQATLNL